uniref:Uncharacterized protein n=1 Tax=Rhizophora mucronata TaxID=61149 RepID=A0A2P2QEF5_RHIMU
MHKLILKIGAQKLAHSKLYLSKYVER